MSPPAPPASESGGGVMSSSGPMVAPPMPCPHNYSRVCAWWEGYPTPFPSPPQSSLSGFAAVFLIIPVGFAPVRKRERMLLADLQGRVTWRPTTENHAGDAASSRHADDVDRINQQLLRRRSMPPLQLRRPDICPPRNHQWPQGYVYVPKPNLTPNTGPKSSPVHVLCRPTDCAVAFYERHCISR